MAANTPDRMMMKIGLIDCTHGTGISQPKMSRFSCSSEGAPCGAARTLVD
jgi:hypothetical protein